MYWVHRQPQLAKTHRIRPSQSLDFLVVRSPEQREVVRRQADYSTTAEESGQGNESVATGSYALVPSSLA